MTLASIINIIPSSLFLPFFSPTHFITPYSNIPNKVPKQFIENCKGLVIDMDGVLRIGNELIINDKVVQKGITSEMIFSIDQIICYVSKFMTLKIGDLIFTGTPKGVGKVNIGDTLIGYIGNKEMFKTKIK